MKDPIFKVMIAVSIVFVVVLMIAGILISLTQSQ